MQTWFRINRSIFSNRIICKDPDHFIVWIYLLSHAAFCPQKAEIGGRPVQLEVGQLITGRKAISEDTNVEESKVQRILKLFEKAEMIKQQSTNRGRTISIIDSEYLQMIMQKSDNKCTANEQQKNNKYTSGKQKMNTYNNYNNSRIHNSDNSVAAEEKNTEASYDIDAFMKKAIGLKYVPDL